MTSKNAERSKICDDYAEAGRTLKESTQISINILTKVLVPLLMKAGLTKEEVTNIFDTLNVIYKCQHTLGAYAQLLTIDTVSPGMLDEIENKCKQYLKDNKLEHLGNLTDISLN